MARIETQSLGMNTMLETMVQNDTKQVEVNNNIIETLALVLRKIDSLDDRIDTLESRIGDIDSATSGLSSEISCLSSELSSVESTVSSIECRID